MPFPLLDGVVFEKNSDEIQSAFKFAMVQYANANRSKLDFSLYVDIINTADAFKLSRLICNQVTRGVVSMLGAVTPDSFDTLHSYTNTFQIPFVTPWFPEKVLPPTSGLVDHAVSLRPDYHQAVIDTVTFYGWKTAIYIYDSHDGLLRLQQLFLSLQPANATFRITNVKRVSNATEVVDFLSSLERQDRWSNKYVILDSSTRLAKDALILHVRDVYLGRRNYHYFLSGLVMDDRWERDVMEFGAINVTGFRVLDYSRKVVKDFIDMWRREGISAQAALMYDTVQVLIDSILRLFRKKPDLLRVIARRNSLLNTTKTVDCNPQNRDLLPFDLGEKLSRTIKRTEIDGLTGLIRFSQEGHRHNFTLQVMEMTSEGDIVKVGTWYDSVGLIPISEPKPPSKYINYYNRSKTYVVSTIEEMPFVIKDPLSANLSGFCVDLTRLLLDKMEITFEIKFVVDGKYGKENPQAAGGWDGMVGELVRQEVDLVIAPLTMTVSREAVVDFSKPFLSFSEPHDPDENPDLITMFSFFRPLSLEVWLLVLCSVFVVGLCLYLVSRFSPHEWRLMSTTTNQNLEEADDNRTTLVNEFSFWNSIWFSLGSFMQQGSDMAPRSISGRIISTVWWFFAFVLVSTYTANLTSYLTVNRINEPLRLYTKITTCPDDIYHGAGWFSFFVDSNQAETNKSKKPCHMLVSATHAGVRDFAVAFPKGSKLRDGVNLALQHLKNEGQLQSLVRRWFLDPQCANDIDLCGLQGKQLTLNQMAGLFYILIGGLGVSLATAILEFIQHGRAEAQRANISLRQALRARPGMNLRNKDLTPQRTPQREQGRLEWNGGAYSEYYASDNQSLQEETEMGGSFSQV
ncbi:glutamate receptor 1-like [Aricia agestis]|uniref:glutamate receptor 1-like n=1 Tax=Aricia agestis TaxID=91739 RepID=UPI001C20AC87|nr:glutamate receptor 1-like [Aricia agestis]